VIKLDIFSTTTSISLLCSSLFLIFYSFFGYRYLLKILYLFSDKIGLVWDHDFTPELSIIIAAYNEENNISLRLENILKSNYPMDKVSIIIASDGSNDLTNEIISRFSSKYTNIFLVSSNTRLGKSGIQNKAIDFATTDIVVFTDAASRFDVDFLKNISTPFSNESIGGVGGSLLFKSPSSSHLNNSKTAYWDYELQLRSLESSLGILAFTSGACMAVRKSLIPILPDHVGDDCIIPLEVAKNKKLWVHQPCAVAFDEMSIGNKNELKDRIRMTSRNWTGTLMYSDLLNPFKNPSYAFSIFSHKILRWLSPFFLLISTMLSVFLYNDGIHFFLYIFSSFFLCGILGYFSNKMNVNFFFTSSIFSFLLANVGFLVGVSKALFRKEMSGIYR